MNKLKDSIDAQQIPDRYEDFNWNEIKTPIKVDVYENLLKKSGYDELKTRFLCKGFQEGFKIQYEGSIKRVNKAKNLPLRGLGTKCDLWNKVMKEVKLVRASGPYKEENIPFDNYIQSPYRLGTQGRRTDQTYFPPILRFSR